MTFQYAQTTYVNAVLSPDVYFVFFCDRCLLCIVQHVRLSLVYWAHSLPLSRVVIVVVVVVGVVVDIDAQAARDSTASDIW